jgi:hypothetical protein
MDPERRGALVESVACAIERHGDAFELPLVTRVYLARALK